jgi:hypothetical protein
MAALLKSERFCDDVVDANEPAIMKLSYRVTGERRKELVKAINQITGLPAI